MAIYDSTKGRKHPIIVTNDLIGREVFFTLPAGVKLKDTAITGLTPNKKYLIIDVAAGDLVVFLDDIKGKVQTGINLTSVYLDEETYFKLAAITDPSTQKKVKLTNGRSV